MVVVRPATHADIAALAAVGMRAWASNIFSFEPELPGMRAHVQQAYQLFAEEHYASVLVAEDKDTILGWGARDKNDDYISDMWVDPEHQGQGIGSLILKALKADIAAAGYTIARLESHARNIGAVRLYQRQGFQIVHQSLEWSESLERKIEKVKMLANLT